MLKALSSVRPSSIFIVCACANASLEMGLHRRINGDLMITSVQDGVHGEGSVHPKGDAVDLRTKNFPNVELKREFADRVKSRLGPKYDVILEDLNGPNEHLHIERDPRR